jgi:hypothetical protein
MQSSGEWTDHRPTVTSCCAGVPAYTNYTVSFKVNEDTYITFPLSYFYTHRLLRHVACALPVGRPPTTALTCTVEHSLGDRVANLQALMSPPPSFPFPHTLVLHRNIKIQTFFTHLPFVGHGTVMAARCQLVCQGQFISNHCRAPCMLLHVMDMMLESNAPGV